MPDKKYNEKHKAAMHNSLRLAERLLDIANPDNASQWSSADVQLDYVERALKELVGNVKVMRQVTRRKTKTLRGLEKSALN